jgi:biotin carboxylase
VPTVPGSEGLIADEKDALAVAEVVGFPLMIKATAGETAAAAAAVCMHCGVQWCTWAEGQ